ncbi:MAG: pirin family protein [Burkholderiaceae bacterium]|nr:pirin family protein [Burkholderiaceae bacterium]
MIRVLQRVVSAQRTSDGAGVTLYRSLGQSQFARLDPFLMLDEFGSERADEYIAGFPAHPHRGFQTVTYMLEGHMLHEDHLGNRGHLKSGGVQWMTAGRGIIHSEMPQQESGAMRGFQLWINLPAREKMKPAGYQDIQDASIPRVHLPHGGLIKVIAGRCQSSNGTVIQGPIHGLSTEPLFFDIHLSSDEVFSHPVPSSHHSFIYVYEGDLSIGDQAQRAPRQAALILGEGDQVTMQSGANGAKAIWLAAKPLHEPIVQHGPFVMNTQEEIMQAITDYQQNRLTTP